MTVTLTRYVEGGTDGTITFAEPATAAEGKLALIDGHYRITRKRPSVPIAGGAVIRASDTGLEATGVTYRFKATDPASADLATLRTWSLEDNETRSRLHGRVSATDTLASPFSIAATSLVGLKVTDLDVRVDYNTQALAGHVELTLDGVLS